MLVAFKKLSRMDEVVNFSKLNIFLLAGERNLLEIYLALLFLVLKILRRLLNILMNYAVGSAL